MPYDPSDGLYTYSPSDPLQPLHALLNRGVNPLNAEVRELRALVAGLSVAGGDPIDDATANYLAGLVDRMTTLEQYWQAAETTLDSYEMLGREAADALLPLNGFTLNPGTMLFTIGDIVFLTLNAKREAGVTAENVVQFNPTLAPPAASTVSAIASQGGSATRLTVVIGTTGTIRNWTSGGANTLFSLTTFWRKAVTP